MFSRFEQDPASSLAVTILIGIHDRMGSFFHDHFRFSQSCSSPDPTDRSDRTPPVESSPEIHSIPQLPQARVLNSYGCVSTVHRDRRRGTPPKAPGVSRRSLLEVSAVGRRLPRLAPSQMFYCAAMACGWVSSSSVIAASIPPGLYGTCARFKPRSTPVSVARSIASLKSPR